VERAIDSTLAGQAADGSWPYGEGRGLGFVDSFHTGYVLECLAALEPLDSRIGEALERGAAYYRRAFFSDPTGRAPLWPAREYPEDAHAAGTGLSALSALHRRGLAERELISRVAARSVGNVRDGHAVYRRYKRFSTRVHYLRWADAHMALGLANAALALSGTDV
jgi:hypothetical protein